MNFEKNALKKVFFSSVVLCEMYTDDVCYIQAELRLSSLFFTRYCQRMINVKKWADKTTKSLFFKVFFYRAPICEVSHENKQNPYKNRRKKEE